MKSPGLSADLEDTARHEAGHALVCSVLDRPILYWRIGSFTHGKRHFLRTRDYREVSLGSEGVVGYYQHIWPEVCRIHEFLIALAGPAAEGDKPLFRDAELLFLRDESHFDDVREAASVASETLDESMADTAYPAIPCVLASSHGAIVSLFERPEFSDSLHALSTYMLERIHERDEHISARMNAKLSAATVTRRVRR